MPSYKCRNENLSSWPLLVGVGLTTRGAVLSCRWRHWQCDPRWMEEWNQPPVGRCHLHLCWMWLKAHRRPCCRWLGDKLASWSLLVEWVGLTTRGAVLSCRWRHWQCDPRWMEEWNQPPVGRCHLHLWWMWLKAHRRPCCRWLGDKLASWSLLVEWVGLTTRGAVLSCRWRHWQCDPRWMEEWNQPPVGRCHLHLWWMWLKAHRWACCWRLGVPWR